MKETHVTAYGEVNSYAQAMLYHASYNHRA